jgi:small nuclear ribonucleoprotein (snRNP)-like protein
MEAAMKVKSLTLAVMLVLAPLVQLAHAQTQSNGPNQTEKIKSEVTRRIAGKKDHVNIELRNGDKLKGRLERADDSKFTLRQDKSDNKLELSYSDVAKIKGQGLGKGAKIGIIVVIAVVAVGVAAYVSIRNTDFFRGGIRVP